MRRKLLAVVTCIRTNWKQICQIPAKIIRKYYYQRNQKPSLKKTCDSLITSFPNIRNLWVGLELEIKVLVMHAI